MAGRFPGAGDIEGFWENLKNGVSAISQLSKEECLEAGVEQGLLVRPNYVRAKGVLEDCDCFDAPFFNVTPREAAMMDPQIRVLHECAFQALEHANVDCGSLEVPVGVFVGAGYNMYWMDYLFSRKQTLSQQFEAGMLNDRDFAATLLAYKLNLTGPAVTMQTACSTTLTTIHFACQSLLAGECLMALAGGVSIAIPTKSGYLFQEGMTHSPDGCCRAFDKDANGTVFGDGVGMVVLKHLDDALEDRDTIHAVIKGSGMNNDGRRKVGYTAPGASGQAGAIGMALAAAEVEPQSIGYVEAHGTGTILGDPIEIEALKMVFPSNGSAYCGVGSVKTNVGHLNNAAGVTGFIKTVLALKHGVIPPTVNFKSPNPALELEGSPFFINSESREWPSNGACRRAGVSSFGVGGTNVHVILEEAPLVEDDDEPEVIRDYQLLPVSAKSEPALERRVAQLAAFLRRHADLPLAGVASTLQTGRQEFELRRFTVAPSIELAAGKLEKWSRLPKGKGDEQEPAVVFLFAGLGGERPEMGLQLYENEPVFRETVDRCRDILGDHYEQGYPQTKMLPFQLGLSELLRSWGVEPAGVMGYSFGEIVAAVTAGVLSLEDALRLVVERSRAVASVQGCGMLSVPMPREQLAPQLFGGLAFAIDNGDSCVVAGGEEEIDTLNRNLLGQQVVCVRLNINSPLHTPAMAPAAERLEPTVMGLDMKPPRIPWLSGVKGRWMKAGETVERNYWLRHLQEPMQVASCMDHLADMDRAIFLEIGPGRELTPLLARRLEDGPTDITRAFSIFPRMLREHEVHYMLTALGRCWGAGKTIDWTLLHNGDLPRRVTLPTYPFDKHRFPCDVTAQRSAKQETPTMDRETSQPAESVDDIQRAMISIWQSYLGKDAIGLDDDFFELGGDSLKASNVAAEIHRETGVSIPVQILFNNPTIRGLSTFAREAGTADYHAIEAVEKQDYYPLSSQQERLYVIQRMQPQGVGYNDLAVLLLEGDVDADRLESAAQSLVRRHEAYRTTFHMLENGPVQRVHAHVDFSIERDSIECPADEMPPMEPLVAGFVRPFELTAAPLLRMRLTALGEARALLLVEVHHIVSDGATIGLMVKDLDRLYRQQPLDPPAVQYRDYTAWQSFQRQTEDWQRQKQYWLDRFKLTPDPLRLPLDKPRPAVQEFSGATVYLTLSPDQTAAVRTVCKQEGITLFMALLAVYKILLWRLSGQDDLVVGTPVAGRRHSQLRDMAGMVVNTLAIRSRPSGEKSIRLFLREIKEIMVEAFAHQDYPLEELVEEVVVERDAARNPLFDVMFVLQEMKAAVIQMEDVRLTPLPVAPPAARFDLTLGANVTEDDGLRLDLTYGTCLFERRSAQRFLVYFANIFDAVGAGEDIELPAIDVIPQEERQRLLFDMNDTMEELPATNSAFQMTMRQPGDRIAVSFEEKTMSYGELQRRARIVGRSLSQLGAGKGSVVVLLSGSSPEAIAAIYGIWSVGAVYVPVDPGYPQERVRLMLEDCGARVVVTELDDDVNCVPDGHAVFRLDEISEVETGVEAENPAETEVGDNAYIIYTSGTTGVPKGAVIPQRGLTNLCHYMMAHRLLTDRDRASQFASLSFDASVLELFPTLAAGAPVVIVPPEIRPDADRLHRFFIREQISTAFLPPAVYLSIMDRTLPGMRVLQVGGETLTGYYRQTYQLINIYGPTETTVLATCFPVTELIGNIPIGTPIVNQRIYIICPHSLTLQPLGVAGELVIAGFGLAAGYLNRPELTEEKFVQLTLDPGRPMERCYRTGDLARRLPDGHIEFLGRIDSQVKIRGFRIELGEIEHVLSEHPAVLQARVLARHSAAGELMLCAYLVSTDSGRQDWRSYLAQRLPEFMIPSFFVELPQLPLTPSGKLDSAGLPAPDENLKSDNIGFQAPLNSRQRTMRRLWSDVLAVEERAIGIDSHFFRLGGHSLKGAMVLARVEREFGVQIPLTELFRRPTLWGLCALIEEMDQTERGSGIEPAEKMEAYPLSFQQRRLFLAQQMEGIGATYNIPVALRIDGAVDLDLFERAFTGMIQRHEILRTGFYKDGQRPVQRVLDSDDPLVRQWTMGREPGEGRSLEDVVGQLVVPFNISRPPLLRVCMVELADDRHLLVVDVHHIVADGMSTAILIDELTAVLAGDEPAPPSLQYKDYALWQRGTSRDDETHPQLDYWLRTLVAPPPPLDLPSMAKRPATMTFAGSSVDFYLPLFKSQGDETLFMRMMALLGVLLFRYSGQPDFMIGTGVAGRQIAEARDMVGMFVNTLPIRLKPSGEMHVEQFFQQVRDTALEALDHQDVPLEDLLSHMQLSRGPSRNPLFDVCLVVQNFHLPTLSVQGLHIEPIQLAERTAKFDATLYVREMPDRISCRLEYNSRLYPAAAMERMASHLMRLAADWKGSQESPLNQMEILSPEEKQQLLEDFNQTERSFPHDLTFPRRFALVAANDPHIVILKDAAANHHVSAREAVDIMLRRAARLLEDFAPPAQEIIAVMSERTIDWILNMMAVMAAGCVYLPLDPLLPPKRLAMMVKDCGARIVLASRSCRGSASCLLDEVDNLEIAALDENDCWLDHSELVEDWDWGDAREPAYVIYTSGSTGTPKGVVVEHVGLGNLQSLFREELSVTPADIILGFANISFDASVWEAAMSLLTGAALLLPDPGLDPNPAVLGEDIIRFGVTAVTLPPVFLGHLQPGHVKLSALRMIVSAGSELPAVLVERYVPLVDLVNAYGPTENTICATWWRANGDFSGQTVPIGDPIPNSRAFILDPELNLQPMGVAGELCLAGSGLARGYLNRPLQTDERFFNWEPGRCRIYRSGDLARRSESGAIEFLGRVDRQIKIRGFRVECGEVEHYLRLYPSVCQAVVNARGIGDDMFLCAYLQWEAGVNGESAPDKLQEYLQAFVPRYMVPDHFVSIERVPLTVQGKIDYAALPDPWRGNAEAFAQEVRPRTGVEKSLQKIWGDILKHKGPFGIDSDFFQMGGHSLKASIMADEIRHTFGVKISLAQLFQRPTIRAIAAAIEAVGPSHEVEEIQPVEDMDFYPQSAAQQRLFFLDQVEGIATSYNMPSAFIIEGPIDLEKLKSVFAALARRHESLRTYFMLSNEGPVQRVAPGSEVDFEVESTNRILDEQALPEAMAAFIRPFDQGRPPLWRVKVVKAGAERHLLLFDMHHIIGDGTSIGVLVKELTALYNGESLPPVMIQYRDFAYWQLRNAHSPHIAGQWDYWLDSLSGDIPKVLLPVDFPRPAVMSFAGSHFEFDYDGPLSTGGETLYMKLLTALNILLFKYSGQEDVIVGSGIAGRRHAALQDLVGMFVNTLTIRNFPSGGKTVGQFSREVSENALKAFENQDIQFEGLVDKLQLDRDPSRNPLFDVCLVVQNFELPELCMEGVTIRPLEFENKTSKFDLSFYARQVGDRLCFNIEYSTSLFRRETIERISRHFYNILMSMEQHPALPIGQIDMLEAAERRWLVEELNQTEDPSDFEVSVVELFRRQLDVSADCVAVGQPDNRQITFGQLDAAANQLARYLLEEGNKTSGAPVGIMLDNSIAAVRAVLGILKAGLAYVVVDPELPEERQWRMLDDASVRLLISSKNYIRRLNRLQWECRVLDTILCLDSHDIHVEPEEESSELMEEKLWEYVGETAADDIEGGGWVSSFTGLPFSREEMDEYGRNVVEKLSPHCHGNTTVLEIGCASGITMFRLAPLVGRYVGCDLSRVIIDKNRERIRREGYDHVEVHCLPAHRIEELNVRDVDIVIINSVIQSFHGHNYLRRVIRAAVDLMAPTGILFIGDVMDADLKGKMILDLEAFARDNRHNGYKTKNAWDAELFVSRRFFEDLRADMPEIADCRFSQKIHSITNELTDYRFDVCLFVDKKVKKKVRQFNKHKHQHDLTSLGQFSAQDIDIHIPLDHPAYVIYTSGTSGNPKGVRVSHRSLANYVAWAARQYMASRSRGLVPLYTNLAFDLTVTSLFLPLITGRTIWAFPKAGDALPILDVLKMGAIDVLKATPSHLSIFADAAHPLPRIDSLVVGGEELTRRLASEVWRLLDRQVVIYNEYGPTEATVGCMIHRFEPDCEHEHSDYGVPIGRPVANTAIYILDRELRPVAVNGVGEIYIGGVCVADGYLNQPELTAERFVKNPFAKGTLYRSGDLGVIRRDGVVEYKGRLDRQVKIRGHRVELLEVQNRIAAQPLIEDCVVTVSPDHCLCGYVTAEEPMAVDKLRETLGRELPSYMIPQFFIFMETFPLTKNGKVDMRALPAPTMEGEASEDSEAEKPENHMEKALMEVWSHVLGIREFPTTANFFQLGGDSIKVIQVASRLQKMGLAVEIKDFFLNPTVRDLAPLVSQSRPAANQEEIVGPVALTPIQHWFFQHVRVAPHHYNQAILARCKGRLEEEDTRQVFQTIVRHHDALRIVVERREDGYTLRNRGVEGESLFHLHFHDFSEHADAEEMIRRAAGEIQESIDLAKGPLVKVGLFFTADDSYLLVCVHHLVMDGVSWRILFEDLTAAFNRAQLPAKTHSYMRWSQALIEYSSSRRLLDQLPYWRAIATMEYPPLPELRNVKNGAPDTYEFTETVQVILGAADTKRLLTDVHDAYHTTINDILLAAVATALCHWMQSRTVALVLEGHGREPVDTDLDITRTIGWFTSRFPVVFRLESPDDEGATIKSVKETLRQVPDKGIGYGVLRYLTPSRLTGDVLNDPEPPVSFNYLGQVGEESTGEFEISPLPVEQSRHKNQERISVLDIDGIVQSGQLTLTVSYPSNRFDASSIATLANDLIAALKKLIRHCVDKEDQEFTPGDFSDVSIGDGDLDDIIGELEI